MEKVKYTIFVGANLVFALLITVFVIRHPGEYEIRPYKGNECDGGRGNPMQEIHLPPKSVTHVSGMDPCGV